MAINIDTTKYVPGTYAKKRPDAAQIADQYIRSWEKKQIEAKEKQAALGVISPAICFSRKIGVGALEIADILAEKIGYRVADREVIEHIANNADISKKNVEFFDEHYPGKINELSALLFKEKSFIMSDYVRHLISAVFSMAGAQPTIFVGRGTHLILPRDSQLAVRFISSKAYRVRRLAEILNVEQEVAEKKIDEVDKGQRDFFKKAFGKKDASPYEFDMVINCDFITQPEWAAEIVSQAFKEKFKGFDAGT
jgi:regulator of RNase E activity RraB